MTGRPLRVFVVVANWNGGEENLECLASLRAQGLPEERIVFVDNGSVDGSRELVRARHPRLVLLENRTNLGFGEAANQGAREALARGADALFFVNNDVVLPEGTLAKLLVALEAHPERGIVGPRVLYRDRPDLVWCAGGMLTWRQNLSTLLGHKKEDGERWRRSYAVDYVAGCSLLVRREVVDRIGLFDASFFAYMEDVDFCLRAKRAGFEVWTIGEAAAHHATSSSTGGGYNPRRKYMMGVNSIWFLKHHAGATEWARFVVFDVSTLPVLWFLGLFQGTSNAVLAKALGIFDGLRGKRVTGASIQEGSGLLW